MNDREITHAEYPVVLDVVDDSHAKMDITYHGVATRKGLICLCG